MIWLTENDADLSSEGEIEPKLRRRYTLSTSNNNNEPQADTAAPSVNFE